MTNLPNGLTPATWTIDPAHSEATFTVRHAGISKVRGSIEITEGTIVTKDALEDSTVTTVLDPATVSTRDKGRDAHLTSGDFFDIANNPTWTFTSTGIRAAGGDYVVVGDLTMHGVTREVELEAEFSGGAKDPWGNDRVGFAASTEISRKDFGMTWNQALEAGGMLVSDKVKIDLDVSAVKQA